MDPTDIYMDGSTEPVIAVIGYPIAGNPSQFAIERALLSLDRQWRVVSFNVAPDRIESALNGLEVLAFRGVLIDPSLATSATEWYRKKMDHDEFGPPLGCLYREPTQMDTFVGDHTATRWLSLRIEKHVHDLGRAIEEKLWVGDEDQLFPIDSVTFESETIRTKVHDPDSIPSMDLVVISARSGRPVDIAVDEWPPSDASTLVVDLTNGHPDQRRIRELGYNLVTIDAIRVGTIQEAMVKWTGEMPSAEVIQEAIEEYLAV